MFELRSYVEGPGLASYGPIIDDIWPRAALFLDRILKGAKPVDLPFEQPTKFEFVINLEDCEVNGHHDPTIDAVARGRGDSMRRAA